MTNTGTDYTRYNIAMATPAAEVTLDDTLVILDELLDEATDAVARAQGSSELDAAQLRRREIRKAIDGVINARHAR